MSLELLSIMTIRLGVGSLLQTVARNFERSILVGIARVHWCVGELRSVRFALEYLLYWCFKFDDFGDATIWRAHLSSLKTPCFMYFIRIILGWINNDVKITCVNQQFNLLYIFLLIIYSLTYYPKTLEINKSLIICMHKNIQYLQNFSETRVKLKYFS